MGTYIKSKCAECQETLTCLSTICSGGCPTVNEFLGLDSSVTAFNVSWTLYGGRHGTWYSSFNVGIYPYPCNAYGAVTDGGYIVGGVINMWIERVSGDCRFTIEMSDNKVFGDGTSCQAFNPIFGAPYPGISGLPRSLPFTVPWTATEACDVSDEPLTPVSGTITFS
jgi:hypothetical protein